MSVNLLQAIDEILEATVGDIHRKNRSITMLFPTFYDRVKAVARKGGVHLQEVGRKLWYFKVHSGTESGKWYDCYLQFLNIEEIITKAADDLRMWNKDRTHIDLSALAAAVLEDADIQLSCSCPAALYWGSDYILSRPKYNARYGSPEDRPPRIRNPREYGAVCKHLNALLKAYPFYRGDMAHYLDKYWRPFIDKAEQYAQKSRMPVKAAARALAQKKEETEGEAK